MISPDETPHEGKKLTSEHYEDACEALEILYLKNNLGGRVQFIKDWPDLALYVFGEELVKFDTEGTEDKDRRAVLEQEAESRRLELLEIAKTLEENSVHKGVLQKEYVDDLIKRLGRDISLLFYAPAFVDAVFPPPPPEPEAQETPPPEPAPEAVQPAPPQVQPETPEAPPAEPEVTPDKKPGSESVVVPEFEDLEKPGDIEEQA